MFKNSRGVPGLTDIVRVLTIGFVAAAVVIVGSAPALAVLVTLNFERDGTGAPLAAGTFITDQWENLGISLSSTNGALRLFNSNCGPGFPGVACTGNDGDLASGATFGPAGDVPAQGNVLIRQEDSVSDPDDTGESGVIRFDFDRQVRLVDIALLDNDNGSGITLRVFKNGSDVPSDTILRQSVRFNNFFENFAFAGDATQVSALEVAFPGSGAIASLTVSQLPIPAALPLMLFALAALAVVMRRRVD